MTERPDPPEEIAQYILDGLNRQNAKKLRIITAYAEDLAAWRDQSGPENENAEDEADNNQEAVDGERDIDRPEGVPGKATIVTKTIDGGVPRSVGRTPARRGVRRRFAGTAAGSVP